MKKICVCFVLLFAFCLLGCSTESNIDTLHKDIQRLEQLCQANLQITDSLKSEDIKQIDQILNTILLRIQELSMAVSRIQAKMSESSTPPAVTPPRGINETIDDLIAKLRSQPDLEKLVPDFKQAGDVAVPRLVEILKTEDPLMKSKTIKILEKLDPKTVCPAVLPLLELDSPARIPAVQLLGSLGYLEAVPKIKPFLESKDNELKFYSADALVKLKTPEGVPVLINYLSDTAEQKRTFAYDTLKKYTEKDFDYRPFFPAEMREESVKKWKDWWQQEGKNFVFPK